MTSKIESQLKEKKKRIEPCNRETDMFERELISAKTELAGVKRTLELERQERRDHEIRALTSIKSAKRKWESTEKDKIVQLNKHIEAQTIRITELCTSNNEMSSRLQRTETELNTANAELHKLRAFQVQYKESLAKLRELSRQSAEGVENKLEQIAVRAHNQIADMRCKLEAESAKNIELETRLRNEEDTNHCRQSRLNVAFEMAQNELKDCQEQLRSIKATIPARDAEIEALKSQIHDRTRQLENATSLEQLVVGLQEQAERLKLENDQLKQQLEVAKSDLSETLLNLEQNEALATERASEDKVALQQQLRKSNENEEQLVGKIRNLEELLSRLELSVTKLETENANLKRAAPLDKPLCPARLSTGRLSGTITEDSRKATALQEKIQSLEQQIQTLQETVAAERQEAKQANRALWKMEKELSNANLDKRIATREAKTNEEKIKTLRDEKQKLEERLEAVVKAEEEKMKLVCSELSTVKSSLSEATKEATKHKLHADSAQRALTIANKQIEEIQSSSAVMRRELDSIHKQLRVNQDRMDNLRAEKERLSLASNKFTEEKNTLETKIEELQQEVNSLQVNNKLLKETCKVLEEQLNDYDLLTSNHETRENTLIQDKMKLQKDLEVMEGKLREARVSMVEEKTLRLVAERAVERMESDAGDLEDERNELTIQRDQYKKLAQQFKKHLAEMTEKCEELEISLADTKLLLETAKAEVVVVKEESSQHLTRMHELKESNLQLMKDLQDSVDQAQDVRSRITELEDVMDDMRRFYEEKEIKAGSTQQQQNKLIDYLQLKLEEYGKKKKTVCDKIFGLKQKENLPPLNTPMPVGYRELETQLEREKAKVKTLTEQLMALKASKALTLPSSDGKDSSYTVDSQPDLVRNPSFQRIRHNVPHSFNVCMAMRTGKCSACLDTIQFGKQTAVCSECQTMVHLKCSGSVPSTCGVPESIKSYGKSTRLSSESLMTLGGSVNTIALDEPDFTDLKSVPEKKSSVDMYSWVKVPGRGNMWERKYLRLEGNSLCTYEHEPSSGMSPISQMDLGVPNVNICENVTQEEIPPIEKSDLPMVLRVEAKAQTTCWPTSRAYIRTLNQRDRDGWMKAFNSLLNRTVRNEKYQTVLKLDKHQLDINTIVEIDDDVMVIGAEEGLFSYRKSQSQCLTTIRGLKKVYQLTLHPHLGLALMIVGEDRQLVYCDLRQLKSNASAAECSRPAISTKSILTGCECCHLYQLQGDMLCAATASHVILLKWRFADEDCGEFIAVRELETTEPCSCALFIKNCLIVGCNKFFQIHMDSFSIDDFPEEDDNSIKAALNGVAKLGIFPVCVLNVSIGKSVELLLCYNEFGVFVNECGQRTRNIDPTWSHLPFAFAFRKPYLFIIHFSSVEVIKLCPESYTTDGKNPERLLIDLSNPRYLGHAGSKGIYISSTNSVLEVLKIEGFSSVPRENGSITSLETAKANERDPKMTKARPSSALVRV